MEEVKKVVKAAQERKQSEENVHISEIRYRTMIEQSPLSIQILSPDGKTLQVNKAWEELWGATLDQMKNYNMLKDKQLTDLGIMPYIKKGFRGESTHIPAVKYYPSKAVPEATKVLYRWVGAFIYPVKDERGVIREVIVAHEDITEQKIAEDALKESEERLRFMAESMPQKIFTATPDGKVDYFNPQWIEYTGLPAERIKNWGWTKFVHPADLDNNIARWKYSIESGVPFEFEHRFRRHDGQYRWHITRAHAMRDEDGKIIMWVGSNTDIHDIKLSLQREQKLQAKTASLAKQRSRLLAFNKAKDEFISLASHQLRTPATGVKQYLGLLLEGYTDKLTVEQKTFIKLAYESNERQLCIIGDLLKVAQLDAGNIKLEKRRTNLVELIEDVIKEQSANFKHRQQKITFKHQQKTMYVEVDSQRTRMVLENIIDNASKYTPKRKMIEVELSQTKEMASIAVRDQGVGINKKDLNKLFRKFSRLHNILSVSAGGTGLGLYWAKKIIDLHGGSIDVETAPKKGSTFIIRLPK